MENIDVPLANSELVAIMGSRIDILRKEMTDSQNAMQARIDHQHDELLRILSNRFHVVDQRADSIATSLEVRADKIAADLHTHESEMEHRLIPCEALVETFKTLSSRAFVVGVAIIGLIGTFVEVLAAHFWPGKH